MKTHITALENIKERTAGLTGLCADYMQRSIRHLQRNCEIECPIHAEDPEALCQQPELHDGARIAAVLADQPKMTAALDAVLATADDLDKQAHDLYAKADRMTDPMFMHRARSRADAYIRIAQDLRRNITDALSPQAAQ